jgi:hypothetical protein
MPIPAPATAVAGVGPEITRQHLLVALEAAAGQHHRARRQRTQQAVLAADDDALNAAVGRETKPHRFCLIKNLGAAGLLN